MPKPDLSHYPCWLREELFPTDPLNCVGRQEHLENERALRRLFDNRRIDPIARTLSWVVLEVIRYRFKMHDLRTALSAMSDRIDQQDTIIHNQTIAIMELQDRLYEIQHGKKKPGRKRKP